MIEEEERGKDIALPVSSSEDEDEEATESDADCFGDSSNSGNDAERTSEHEEDSPKVDITDCYCRNILPFVPICVYV
jgi:hypothetical protein